MNTIKAGKPLLKKAYGSIGHLPTSRLGPGDHSIDLRQAGYLTRQKRDRHETVIVQEKLDGSNVCVARKDGHLIALTRAGYLASSSKFIQHQYFNNWFLNNFSKFTFLQEGERICGEWLAMAHSTRYELKHDPFVAFDIFREDKRVCYDELKEICDRQEIVTPYLIQKGDACPIDVAEMILGEFGHHGAIDPVEGLVYRMERKGDVLFLGKYVRPGKLDGTFFNDDPDKLVWNWKPS